MSGYDHFKFPSYFRFVCLVIFMFELYFSLKTLKPDDHLIILSSCHLRYYQQIKRKIGEATQVAVRNTESLILQRVFLIEFPDCSSNRLDERKCCSPDQ